MDKGERMMMTKETLAHYQKKIEQESEKKAVFR